LAALQFAKSAAAIKRLQPLFACDRRPVATTYFKSRAKSDRLLERDTL
jgi:hypothetical protein